MKVRDPRPFYMWESQMAYYLIQNLIKMVTVTGFKIVETPEGDSYVRLILQGDLEMVQSSETGNFYATARRSSISCTFDEVIAEKMIGKELEGRIISQETDPYEFTVDSGDTIKLSHRWIYTEESEEDLTIQELVKEATPKVKKNGKKEAVTASCTI